MFPPGGMTLQNSAKYRLARSLTVYIGMIKEAGSPFHRLPLDKPLRLISVQRFEAHAAHRHGGGPEARWFPMVPVSYSSSFFQPLLPISRRHRQMFHPDKSLLLPYPGQAGLSRESPRISVWNKQNDFQLFFQSSHCLGE